MLSVLVEGTLTAAPVARTSSKGQPYTTVQMRTSGGDGETVWCSVIAFQAAAAEALARLAAGDTVAVAGPASLSQWQKGDEHRVGLKVTATRVLTVYEAGMRRRVASAGPDRATRSVPQPSPPDRARHAARTETSGPPPRLRRADDDDGPV